jgi:putative membrane protein
MIAYCGPEAVPDDLWIRWNFDPLLIAAFAALALAVSFGRSAAPRAGWVAVTLLFVIFVSPLCALSSALFSVRVFHHVLLVAAVAPLLAVALPLKRAGSPRWSWCMPSFFGFGTRREPMPGASPLCQPTG